MVLDPTKHYNPDGTVTNADGTPAGGGSTATKQPKRNADGSPTGSNVFAGSTFGADANVGGTDVAGFLKDADPRDFMYGRDPNYATNAAANERSVAGTAQASLNQQGAAAASTGDVAGHQIAAYGQGAANELNGMAGGVYGAGMSAAGRSAPVADYGTANSSYLSSEEQAQQLASLTQGPSAAQAQLQSGLNQSEASNLAMARSGRGFGGSASALTQAAGANAAATQQATNASAQLSAQEQNAWNAQHASNLANAAGITTGVGSQLQQQGLSQAQLQAQATAQNDQAQATLTGEGLQSTNQAGQLGLSGMTSGIGAIQTGETLDMQGTQAAMGAYGQGEQMAGINMTAQQQADLTREQGLIQNRGIDAGIAVGNQAAVNSGWGTALSTAATIGGAVAASDASAKTGIQPLDAGAKPIAAGAPTASAAPPVQSPKAPSLVAPALQTGGAILGGAIGTAIAPGIGTAIGGVAGSLLGKAAGGLISSDIHTKADAAPLDAGAGAIGYGQTNPSGSTLAGASNAFNTGRDAAAKAEASAADADLKSQAKGAAIQSMLLGSAAQDLHGFGAGSASGVGALDQFTAMGKPPAAPAYGAQPSAGWGSMQPGMVQSDAHSKTAIRELKAENKALKAEASQSGPTQEMLNQAAADQDMGARVHYPAYGASAPTMSMLNQQADVQDSPGGRIAYPASPAPPTAAMLNQAAADQDSAPVPYSRVANYTSDEDEKSGIHRSDALDMVDEAPGYSYVYKDPARHGYGQKFGPMAQDLLKTPAGASTVEKAPDGTLAVNTGRLALVEHAAMHSDRKENAAKFAALKAELDALKNRKAS